MRRIALLGALAAAAAWAPAPARIAGTARVRVAGCRSSARCFAAAADVDDDSAVPAEASEAERLTAEASRLRAQADVLRLEAEKDALLLEKQVLVAKDLQRAAQAELISNLRLYADANDVDGLRTTLRRKRSIVDMALFDSIREGALDDSTRLKTVEEFYTAVMDALVMEDEKLAARIKSDLKSSSLPAFGMAKKAPTFTDVNGTTSSLPRDIASMDEESQQKLFNKWLEAVSANSTSPSAESIFGTSGEDNNGMVMMMLPDWIPPGLQQFVRDEGVAQVSGEVQPMDSDRIAERLKEVCFGIDTFYVTNVNKSPYGVLFTGNLRGDSEAIYAKVQERLATDPELAAEINLFMLEDPTAKTIEEAMEDDTRSPSFVAMPARCVPRSAGATGLAFSIVTLGLAMFTTLATAIGTFALNTDFFQRVQDGDVAVAGDALPVAAGVIAIAIAHELGHLAASRLAKGGPVSLAPPVLLPSIQLGTFGTITRFLSFPATRSAAFDVAVSGPVLGFASSLGALVSGLSITSSATASALASFPVLPAAVFKSSLLVGALSSLALPAVLDASLQTPIPVHPLAVIGVLGLIGQAFNFMPVGRLDGGRCSTAVFGRRPAALVSTLTLLLQAGAGFFAGSSLQLFWGIVVVLFQRDQDIPAMDDITAVDDGRTALFFALSILTVLTILPFPTGTML